VYDWTCQENHTKWMPKKIKFKLLNF
jgi:hypothetical protein